MSDRERYAVGSDTDTLARQELTAIRDSTSDNDDVLVHVDPYFILDPRARRYLALLVQRVMNEMEFKPKYQG